jgi:hypothetical protein
MQSAGAVFMSQRPAYTPKRRHINLCFMGLIGVSWPSSAINRED